jgi:hypothetical protein
MGIYRRCGVHILLVLHAPTVHVRAFQVVVEQQAAADDVLGRVDVAPREVAEIVALDQWLDDRR